MIRVFSVNNYRSVTDFVTELSQLNVVTGPNGCGKSNLYKALRLLSSSANGTLVREIAKEGGLSSVLYAGPDKLSRGMKDGSVPIQGNAKKNPVRLNLGFSSEDLGYSVSLGLPLPGGGIVEDSVYSATKFSLDPEIKRECIWSGSRYKPTSCLVDRQGAVVKVRRGRSWEVITNGLNSFDSILSEIVDPKNIPEIYQVRQSIRNWRFYDHFRTDRDSKTRIPKIGTRTPVLDHDGYELAAALQTIIEIGDKDALYDAIEDAFPGSRIKIRVDENALFSIEFFQAGLLRPLSEAELSDGTLRFLLLVAVLLTPRPPSLLVLNEPETSLHPDLLPALGKLIRKASQLTQVWVVSHANRLVSALSEDHYCHAIELDKELGQTYIRDQDEYDKPPWKWPT